MPVLVGETPTLLGSPEVLIYDFAIARAVYLFNYLSLEGGRKKMEVLEIAFEALSLVTASIALTFLVRARVTRSLKPAIILLYLCVGFNVAEVITRRFLRIKATAESATIETVTLALIITALVYALRAKRKGAVKGLSPAIICMVWTVTIFALELLLGYILRFYR